MRSAEHRVHSRTEAFSREEPENPNSLQQLARTATSRWFRAADRGEQSWLSCWFFARDRSQLKPTLAVEVVSVERTGMLVIL